MNIGMNIGISSKKLRCSIKIIVIVVIMVVISLEWLEHMLMPIVAWPKFVNKQEDSIRILIVGDPQLLGNRYSPPGLFGYICRLDADRYIAKTFSQAFNYLRPDLVVFLGDNLDEGEIANDSEFLSYVKRFQHVFQEVDFRKTIIVPGDNDIGGEDEPPSPELEKRFNRYFREDVFIRYNFLEFVKVNFITHSNQYLITPNISANAIRIVVSHMPLTNIYSNFISKMMPFLQPHIILSAHDHKSSHWIAKRQSGILEQMASFSDLNSCSFNVTDEYVHEIMVPTCSYRMGTYKMGYGALDISSEGRVSYAVLWLPSRFRQLVIYIILSIFLCFVIMLSTSKAFYRFVSNQNFCRLYRNTYSYLPL